MAKKRFLLRVDPRVYEALEKWAADDLRSVNAQMEYLLSEELKRAGRYPKPSQPAPPPPDTTPEPAAEVEES